MLRNRMIKCVLAAAAVWVTAADVRAERPQGDWIEGRWRAVTTTLGGQPSPTLKIQDDRVRFEFETGFGGAFFMESRIVSVDNTQSPAHLDLVFEDTNLPEQFGDVAQHLGASIKAIYRVEDDLITIVHGEPGSDNRPTQLDTDRTSGAMVFVGRRDGGDAEVAMNAGLPAEMAGTWRYVEPMVLEVKEGLITLRFSEDGEAFEQHELIALGFNAEGAGRLASVVLEAENRGTIGRGDLTRIDFDGPDRMTSAFYPPGHPKAGTWPESLDLNNIPAGMMVATWERMK
ncbi:MAG: hypothetical protein AAF333_18850 [Planctomycetota bacterium]